MTTQNPESDPDPLELLIADYISGEMLLKDARAFETRMLSDAPLSRRVESLSRTARTVDAALADPPHAQPADPIKIHHPQPHEPDPVLRYAWPFARYAAVWATAFFLGMYAVAPSPQKPQTPIAHDTGPAMEQLAQLKVDSTWARGAMHLNPHSTNPQ